MAEDAPVLDPNDPSRNATPVEERRGRGYALLLVTVALGCMVAPLNSSMLFVALPEIRQDFGVSHAAVAWLLSAYLIAMGVAMPLGGRLGDQIGRTQIFRYGMFAFLGFSLAAMVSPNFETLVVFRTGQALVSAAIIPNALAMLRVSIAPHRLGVATGTASSMMALAGGIGPLLGTAALELGSWRLVFLANVPIFVLGFACFTLLRYRETLPRQKVRLDWAGALSLTALMLAVTFLLGLSGEQGGALIVAAGAAVAATLLIFCVGQMRSARPIAEWRLFKNRSFAGANTVVMLCNLAQYAVVVAIPFFVEEVQGKSASTTGPMIASMPILMAAMAPIAGTMGDAVGRRLPACIGSALAGAASLLLLLGVSQDVSFMYLAFCMALFGLGVGLAAGPATTAAIESATREHAGAAAGTVSMMRYVGGIIGAGVLGGVLSQGDAPTIDAIRMIFGFMLVAMAISTVAATFIHRFTRETRRERELALRTELTATGGQ